MKYNIHFNEHTGTTTLGFLDKFFPHNDVELYGPTRTLKPEVKQELFEKFEKVFKSYDPNARLAVFSYAGDGYLQINVIASAEACECIMNAHKSGKLY